MLKKFAQRRASIRFTIDIFTALALSLTCSIAFQLAGKAMLRQFEIPADRPITNYDAKR